MDFDARDNPARTPPLHPGLTAEERGLLPESLRTVLEASEASGCRHGMFDFGMLARSTLAAHREPRIVKDDREWACAGCVCRRVQLLVAGEAMVVFVSDANAQRSVTNRAEHLVAASRHDFFAPASGGTEVSETVKRFFEYRTGERTADGVAQSRSFHEIKIGARGAQFWPARDDVAQAIAQVLGVDLKTCE